MRRRYRTNRSWEKSIVFVFFLSLSLSQGLHGYTCLSHVRANYVVPSILSCILDTMAVRMHRTIFERVSHKTLHLSYRSYGREKFCEKKTFSQFNKSLTSRLRQTETSCVFYYFFSYDSYKTAKLDNRTDADSTFGEIASSTFRP